MNIYVDVFGGRDRPGPGWYLQAVNKKGCYNSTYFILDARQVKRRTRGAVPRIMLTVERVHDTPKDAKVWEFRWYPRRRRPIPVAIQRLMDEVALERPTPHGLHDRQHNRHNRS
jgi:hypothetical protein